MRCTTSCTPDAIPSADLTPRESSEAVRARLRRIAQIASAIALVAFAGWYLWRQWRGASTADLRLDVHWGALTLASFIVLATYTLLVETWRRVLVSYGYHIAFRDAARVWFVSNLGKYVPGKIWQVTAMAEMLRRLRVALPDAASASAVITVANVVAGFGLALLIGTSSLRALGGRYESAVVAATILLLAALLAAPFTARALSFAITRMRGRTVALTLPRRAVALSLMGCTAAWLLYGSAFQLLVYSLFHTAPAPWIAYVVAYTLSYLVGYLVIIAPGGFGPREATLSTLLVALHAATPAQAVVITIVSRLWLTVLEVGPGILFLVVKPASPALPTANSSPVPPRVDPR